jgi:hypothetical protein
MPEIVSIAQLAQPVARMMLVMLTYNVYPLAEGVVAEDVFQRDALLQRHGMVVEVAGQLINFVIPEEHLIYLMIVTFAENVPDYQVVIVK